MKVFLSHSSADHDLACRLSSDLKAAKVDVWLDQWEIGVGEEFVQSIERGLDEAAFVIVLPTVASVTSDWVTREWRTKVEAETHTRRIAVVPVRGEPCEIPDFLAQRSSTDISGGAYPLGLSYLLTMLRYYSDAADIEDPGRRMVTTDSSLTMIPIVSPIALEVSRDLIPIFERDSQGANRFIDKLASGIHDALREEFGFQFPGIRVHGNELDMPPRSALIMIDEVPSDMVEVGPDDVLVEATVEGLAQLGIIGERRDDPVTGRVRARIAAADRAAADRAGLATWDAAEYLCLVLHAVMRRMAALFLEIDGVWRLVNSVETAAPELVAATVPKAVSWFELTDILRRLVREEIGIGDIGRILEALSKRPPDLRDTVLLAEQVRHALNQQITVKFLQGRNSLPVLLLDPGIEVLIGSTIQRTATGAYLHLEPEIIQDILAAIRISSLGPRAAGAPILLTEPQIRSYVRHLVELEFPSLQVLSRADIAHGTQIETIAEIRIECASHDPTPAG